MQSPQDYSSAVYYSLRHAYVANDRTIVIPTSGVDVDPRIYRHWSGELSIEPTEPDYGLWMWIMGRPDRFAGLISGDTLEVIREKHLHLMRSFVRRAVDDIDFYVLAAVALLAPAILAGSWGLVALILLPQFRIVRIALNRFPFIHSTCSYVLSNEFLVIAAIGLSLGLQTIAR